ncbi:hypothetical protein HMPREF1557_01693 [Streptococcus sobrinus W1703]|uniref:Uncharacterized protein n=1 Tax=Streptococcus sobrinus W1703 TaxID=1227275 RepID=U2KB63_9STRE|nr:hypothetical protein HMPREF1557_01693 [Streptococcus sobrinus W1703]
MAPGPYLTKKSSRKLKLKLWQIITLAISGFVLLCFLGFGGYAAWHYQTGNIEGTWHRVKAKYYDADKDKWTYFDEEDDAKEFDSDDNQDGGEYYLTVHQDKTVQFFGYSFISDDDDDGYDLGDYDSDDNDSDSWESDDYFNDKKDDYDVESYRNTTTRNPSTSDDDYNSDEDYEDSDDYDYDDDDYGYEKVPIISLEDYMAGSYKVSQWNRAIVPAYSRSQYRKKLSSLFDRKFKDYLGSDDDEIIDDMVDTYANYIGRGNDKHSTMAYQVKGDKLILTIRNKTGKMISQLTYEKLNDSQTQDAKETYSQEKEQFEENNAIN